MSLYGLERKGLWLMCRILNSVSPTNMVLNISLGSRERLKTRFCANELRLIASIGQLPITFVGRAISSVTRPRLLSQARRMRHSKSLPTTKEIRSFRQHHLKAIFNAIERPLQHSFALPTVRIRLNVPSWSTGSIF